MLSKIGIAVAIVLLGLVVLVAMQPSTFRIERSREITAPAYVVFDLINNFKHWSAWSPWEKLDPTMKKKYAGPETGVGAVYEWSGDKQVGAGRMAITESEPGKKVGIELEFKKPWQATNRTYFVLEPAGRAVVVTWTMEGDNDFMSKAASLFLNVNESLGKDFEAGLREMDSVARREAKQVAKAKAEKLRQLLEAAKANVE